MDPSLVTKTSHVDPRVTVIQRNMNWRT